MLIYAYCRVNSFKKRKNNQRICRQNNDEFLHFESAELWQEGKGVKRRGRRLCCMACIHLYMIKMGQGKGEPRHMTREIGQLHRYINCSQNQGD